MLGVNLTLALAPAMQSVIEFTRNPFAVLIARRDPRKDPHLSLGPSIDRPTKRHIA